MDLISLLGYSKNSPYAGNPYLDIHTPEGLIDMSNTPMDLIGIDNKGNKKKMKAGRKNPYKFEGDMVREIPMQRGGRALDPLRPKDLGVQAQDNTRRLPLFDPVLVENTSAQSRKELPVVGPARKEYVFEKNRNDQRRNIYAASQPNAQIVNGQLTEKNPAYTMEGEPFGPNEKRFQKGMEHIVGGLEAAGYLTGVGELYRGLKGAKTAANVIDDIYWNGKNYQNSPLSNPRIISQSSGMDAVYAKQPGYNSHLFNKQGYVPPTTDSNLKAFIDKSEIDWGKWNSEIPNNKALMNEYNTIEQTSKANNTWMKNSDGSNFKGTPEQFVQQQSSNFKKAFPEGFTSGYRGAHQHITDFKNRDRNDWATFLTDSKVNAETYAKADGLPKKFYHPDINKPDDWKNFNTDGIYQLAFQKDLPRVVGNAQGNNWRFLNYDNNIAKGVNPARLAENHEFRVSHLNSDIKTGLDYPNDFSINKKYLTTDDYASYVKNNPEGIAEIKNVKDQMGYDKGIKSNTVYAVDAERVPLKSLRYNNGMFDMTNPNIYKALIPTVVGTGVGVSKNNPYQEGGLTKESILNFLFDDKEDTEEVPVKKLENTAPSADDISLEDNEQDNLAMEQAMMSDNPVDAGFGNPYNGTSNSLSRYGQEFQNIDQKVAMATQELLQKFPNLRLTSGRRNWGDKDAHPRGRAVDISYDKNAYDYYQNVIVPKYGFNPALKPNHGTGPHIHLGYY